MRENISLWLDHSEPDYYLFFLKAWIPFNAWYVLEYPDLKKKDSEIVKKLQDDVDSKPRKIIEAYLKNTIDDDALKFKGYLAELHHLLEKNKLTHSGYHLSFKDISLTNNPVKYKHFLDKEGNVYKTEKTMSYCQAYVESKSGKVLLDMKKPFFNIEDLRRDTGYIRLGKKIQKIIFDLYCEINPKKPISLISNSQGKDNYILLKNRNPVKFISDVETVAKGCIKVLYALRCMLFHGEIAPTKTNREVYENAYYLLLLILKKFK